MKNKRIIIFILFFVVIFFLSIFYGFKETIFKKEETKEILNEKKNNPIINNITLGAYYWSGFTYLDDHYTDRLFNEFADREPLWGWVEDSYQNMEHEIDIASENGISFFAFDWYYKHPLFNSGLKAYLNATNNNKMNFSLLVVLSGEAAVNQSNWKDASNYYIEYMTNSHYLKVDGKPVITFFRVEDLISQLGGVSSTKSSLDYLRNEMKKRGYSDITVLGCECAYGYNGEIDYNPNNTDIDALKTRLDNAKNAGFDGFTSYNCRQYRNYGGDMNVKSIPYETMANQHILNSEGLAKYSSLKIVPNILSGWDSRPWETNWSQNTTGWWSLYASNRTPQKLYDHIINTKNWMDQNKTRTLGNLAIIYAWNEVCEGGYLVPTKGDNGSYLDIVNKAVDKINTMN